MSGVPGLRFRDLAVERGIDVLEPLPGIRELGILLEVLRHLVADQMGVDNKQHCGQESFARPVLAAQDALRPEHSIAVSAIAMPSGIFWRHQFHRTKKTATGTITTMTTNQKFGLADANRIELNTLTIPLTTAAVRRCSTKPQQTNCIVK